MTARRTLASLGTSLSTALAAALTVTALAATPAAADTEHRVRAGDTVSALAFRYGTTVGAITAANGLDSRATIYVGRTIVIPDGAPERTEAPRTDATHKVGAGDTVWALAHRHGITVSSIMDANGLGPRALIRVGQTLTLPGVAGASPSAATAGTGTSTAAPTPASSTYTVRAGDTLGAIAARNGTTVAALAKANSLTNPSLIRIGQRLTVPGAPTGLVGDTFLGQKYPADVVAAANVNKATLLARDVPTREQMRAMVVATAQRHGVDPALAQAVATQESGFDMRAVSPANAIGVMQVIPASGEWASGMAGRRLDLLDPQDNVTAGVLILRSLTRTFDDLDNAIGGYYQGAAAVKKHGLYDGTVTYVRSVRALMARY